MNIYEKETRERWGSTETFREHTEKTKNYTKEKWAEANDGLMSIFAEFAECKEAGFGANSEEAKALVSKLQKHISAYYYTCTNEILSGLGKMYVANERFRENINKHGVGTAEFVSVAIEFYLK